MEDRLSVETRRNFKLLQEIILSLSLMSDIDKENFEINFDRCNYNGSIDALFIAFDKFQEKLSDDLKELGIKAPEIYDQEEIEDSNKKV